MRLVGAFPHDPFALDAGKAHQVGPSGAAAVVDVAVAAGQVYFAGNGP
jgi:hypothetical protein